MRAHSLIDNMKTFTGFEYLLIDAANQWGLDKQNFEDRIQWATDNLEDLEAMGLAREKWKEKPLFLKAVKAIHKARRGEPTGHLVGFDAASSGPQIMSVLTACETGCLITGLVDPELCVDSYQVFTDGMNTNLQAVGHSVNVAREDAKQAVMTALYGSENKPKEVFGDGTVELQAFYTALQTITAGAYRLLFLLVNSWRSDALEHCWQLPDGFQVKARVMESVKKPVEIDELGHHTFTYQYKENRPLEREVMNAANVVHSVDGYILRTLYRRCMYNKLHFSMLYAAIKAEIKGRETGHSKQDLSGLAGSRSLTYYVEQYNRSTVADIVIAEALVSDEGVDEVGLQALGDLHLYELDAIVRSCLEHEPFELVTIHDNFLAHPNNLNWVRGHYRDILGRLAESHLVDDLLTQLYQRPVKFDACSDRYMLSSTIYNSNYGLT